MPCPILEMSSYKIAEKCFSVGSIGFYKSDCLGLSVALIQEFCYKYPKDIS